MVMATLLDAELGHQRKDHNQEDHKLTGKFMNLCWRRWYFQVRSMGKNNSVTQNMNNCVHQCSKTGRKVDYTIDIVDYLEII